MLAVVHVHVWLRQRHAAADASFAPIVLAMACELSLDLIRAMRVTAELDRKTAELQSTEQRPDSCQIE